MSTAARLLLLSILASSSALSAETTTATPTTWSINTSLTARAGYDDNVFLQDRAPLIVPGAVPDRAGSWFSRAGVGIEASWHLSPAFECNLGYSPELVRYDAFSSENHDDHRIDLGAHGRINAWSYQTKGSILLVDGSRDSPVFGHTGGTPAIGGASVRSRRDQLNTKLGGTLTRAVDTGFVRAIGDYTANDFDSRHSAVPGYANYVDRSEWSAGFDAGHYIKKDFAFIAAVRTGGQHQGAYLGNPLQYSNTLTRILVGAEGKPTRNLTLHALGGPDFRHYERDVAAGFDRTRSARYIEGAATWTPRETDTVALTFKDYLWLSSGGRGAYQNTTGNLLWKHVLNPLWSASLAADVQTGDNRDYSATTSQRFDWIYTGTLDITRSLGPKTKLDLEFIREWSDSVVAGKPGREYTRLQVSLGVRRVF
ncbi:hypothetical protein [Rariglobus hedericola]|uniref:Outer membrane beta-barrel protein n=1 Tax=Rariglobus hedericola TaxID=2597822 RepID=A0A556QK56_9BACT|nr:hypothetical protein [Rariglobus hedericola]TSJ77033.1 hypothetical protein FPL22_13055 [Rariglobus hedericola]